MAIRDLRRQASPSEEDYQIAAALFERAALHDPQPGLLRRWIDAADAAGDDASVERATRQLIVADPSDTVAQLRLISGHLRRAQTAPERLAATVKLAKPQSGTKVIDASVRSRLALDGALLARELGDEQQFVELLTLATQLDATNKDAAVLALNYALSDGISPVEQMELLSNVLLADPLDPAAHRGVRDLLASVGAFGLAERFQGSMQRIWTVSAIVMNNTDRVEQLAIVWRAKGPGVVVEALTQDLAAARFQQARILEGTKSDLRDLRRPEEVRLSLVLEEMRLAAAIAAGSAEAIKTALTDMDASVADLQAQLAAMPTPDPESTARVRQAELTGALWRLVAGEGVATLEPKVESLLAAAREEGLEDVLRGWLQLHALGSGGTTTSSDDAWGVLLRVRQATVAKDKAALARRIEEAQPLTAIGSLASTWAREAEPGYRHPSREAIERVARSIPSWVDSMSSSPFLFQRVTIEPQKLQASTLEPVAFELVIQNLSSVPLGLGEGRPIDARFLLGPALQLGNESLSRQLVAEVVSVASRLRIMPREQVRTSLWIDDTPIGWVAGTGSRTPQVLRMRALQGFITDDQGVRRAGPGCLDASSAPLTRAVLAPSVLPLEQLAGEIAAVSKGSLEAFQGVLVACRAQMLTASELDQPQAMLTLGDALAKEYAGWSAEQKLLALAELPTTHDLPAIAMNEAVGMAAFDAAASQEVGAGVLAWVLVTRVRDATSPVLARAEAMPELAGLAQAVRRRLSSPEAR